MNSIDRKQFLLHLSCEQLVGGVPPRYILNDVYWYYYGAPKLLFSAFKTNPFFYKNSFIRKFKINLLTVVIYRVLARMKSFIGIFLSSLAIKEDPQNHKIVKIKCVPFVGRCENQIIKTVNKSKRTSTHHHHPHHPPYDLHLIAK